MAARMYKGVYFKAFSIYLRTSKPSSVLNQAAKAE